MKKELKAILQDWLKFSEDVQPACAAGKDWLDELRRRTKACLVISKSRVLKEYLKNSRKKRDV
jgi:hypothetical protein